MTNDLALRVRKLELTRSVPTLISQAIAGQTLPATTTTFPLTAVPIGKLVTITIPLSFRLASGFVNAQIFDGATQVGTTLTVLVTTGSQQIFPMTQAFAGTFAGAPTLRIYSNTAATVLDPSRVVGLAFGSVVTP